MPVYYNAVYTKPGAVFADADAAQADKIQFYGDLEPQIQQCWQQMMADGILLEPIYRIWHQDTHTLTSYRLVSSPEEYKAAFFNSQAVLAAEQQAGWQLVSEGLGDAAP